LKTLETTATSAWPARALGWFFVFAVVATHAFFLWNVRERISRGDPDFTVFYTAGKILRERHGGGLYDPYVQQAVQRQFTADSDIRRGPLPYIHPPFEALVFLPLTLFPYPVAFAIWEVLNLVMLIGVAFALRGVVDRLRETAVWKPVLLSVAFFPVFANFHQGQDAILLLLVVTMGFRAMRRNAELAAGCWLGFGVFKYHLIVPLVFLLILWRGRRLALGFGAVAGLLTMISLVLVGWRDALQYPAYAWQVVSNTGLGGIPLRQLPNLVGLLAGWPVLENFRMMAWIAGGAAATLVVWVAVLRRCARSEAGLNLCLAVAVVVALLVGFSTNTYDLSLLVLPLALVADYYFFSSREFGRRQLSIVLPAIPLLISPLWFFLWLRWERINLIAIFLLWWVWAIRGEIVRSGSIEGAERGAIPSL
jgi:hypothetical protein